jgi:uncharacterized DUF497 family protein
MEFEWDPAKDSVNRAKHGISFEEASRLFGDDNDVLEIYDDEHSIDEDRFIAIGRLEGDVIVVIYSEQDETTIRLISARKATPAENARFEAYWREPHGR